MATLDITHNLNLTLGMLEVGVLISMFGFGILTSQVYSYYENFSEDKNWLKLSIAAIWSLELAHVFCITYSLYRATVTSFGNPLGLLVQPALIASILIGSLVGSFVQAIFAHKIYVFSKKLWYPLVCWILLVTRIGLSIACIVKGFQAPTIPNFTHGDSTLLTTLIAVAAGADVLIAGGLIYYFRSRRTDALSQRNIVVLNRLIMYSIESGLATSVTSVSIIFCFQFMPSNFVYIAPFSVLARLYSNSLLVSLNSRTRLQKEAASIALSSYVGVGSRDAPSRMMRNNQRISQPVVLISQTYDQKFEPTDEEGTSVKSNGYAPNWK